MGKRYYCDYCDRSFIDDVEARKKHINGSMHVRLKKEHYDMFRDIKTLYAEESSKEPCKRFLRTGECVFGANCRFTHFSWQQLEELRLQIEADNQPQTTKAVQVQPGDGSKILSAWLKKRTKGHLATKLEPETKQLWKLPPNLQGRQDLPPSLQPITPESFTCSEFEEWG